MSRVKQYGYPPEAQECAETPMPSSVKVRVDHQMLSRHTDTGMAPFALNRALPPAAVVRQLYAIFREDLPVAVMAPGYGVFLIGGKGWKLVENG